MVRDVTMALGHKQVSVYCPIVEEDIEVDAGIATLIKKIWDLDIMTLLSCENSSGHGPDCVWIEFQAEEAESFLGLITSHGGEDSPLHCAVTGSEDESTGARQAWFIQATYDEGLEIGIVIPHIWLPEVHEALDAALVIQEARQQIKHLAGL